jgi:TIR domain
MDNAMIKFEIGGRAVNPKNMKDAIMSALLDGIAKEIRSKVGGIRDPNTGEFPTIVVRGKNIENLHFVVEGSPEIVELVKQQLEDNSEQSSSTDSGSESVPRVFLSYASEDKDFAQGIAESLQQNGVDTWWDNWCIKAGDSFRQKIDEGLSGCTHFLVLLTPQSIDKPWINQEIDAGLVRKLNDQCRLLPVRHKLAASALPPLLSGTHAPEITDDSDITQLINDIFDVSRKPPLGTVPEAIAEANNTKTGYSVSATAIAKYFVEQSTNGLYADPQISFEDLAQKTSLSVPDVKDGIYELTSCFRDSPRRVMVDQSLFVEFDKYWMPWNPADDALKLAVDIFNDPEFPSNCREITDRYGWEPRRLNPAITFLFERGILMDYGAMSTHPFAMIRVVGKVDELRRFVRSRQ